MNEKKTNRCEYKGIVKHCKKFKQHHIDYIAYNLPTHSIVYVLEGLRMLGCAAVRQSVEGIARSFGIKKDAEYMAQYNKIRVARLRNGLDRWARENPEIKKHIEQRNIMNSPFYCRVKDVSNKESQSKGGKMRFRRYRIEKTRIALGLEQTTKLKVQFNPKKVYYKAKLRRLGYIVTDGNDVYVQPDTFRHVKMEEFSQSRYGLQFFDIAI